MSAQDQFCSVNIIFIHSTHVETVCLLELSMFPVTVAGEGK